MAKVTFPNNKALKTHKLPSMDHAFVECGRDSLGYSPFRISWSTQWRDTTCKNRLRKKKI